MDRNFWDEAKLNRLKISFDISLIFTLFGPFLIAAATGKLFLFPILLLIGIGSCFWFSFQAEEFLLEERKRRRERWAELDSSERERVLARRRQASRGYTEQDLWLARQYQARRDCAPFRDYAEQDLYFAQQ